MHLTLTSGKKMKLYLPSIEATYITLKAIPEEGNGAVFIDHFQLQNSLSIKESSISNNILSPNPTSSQITFESTEMGPIEIYSILGVKLFERSKEHKSININVSNYNPGVYTLKMNGISKYFIKE